MLGYFYLMSIICQKVYGAFQVSLARLNRVVNSVFLNLCTRADSKVSRVDSMVARHKCSENLSTRADPRVQEPTRPEDCFGDRPFEPTRIQASRLDQKMSKCAEQGEPTPTARSRPKVISEPTRRCPSRLEAR